MQSIGTTEWLNNRPTRGPLSQSISSLQRAEAARDFIIPAVNSIRSVPSWTILASVLLAASAICATVVVRSRAEFRSFASQRETLASEIDLVRGANASLQVDIHRLTHDPNAIELAARERLGMVKANDVVVPMESINSSRTVSFVR
ncbi:MAG: septum formation initiator family protein [Pyrinomonadaceae bacterium]